MEIRQLFADEDAVSPVIGVILMVAITVILAAVIGAFVLGFGGGGPTSPTIQWDVDEHANATTWTHDTGDALDAETDSAYFTLNGEETDNIDEQRYTTGSEILVANESSRPDLSSSPDVDFSGTSASGDWENGDTLRLVWSASGEDDTSAIGSHDLADQ